MLFIALSEVIYYIMNIFFANVIHVQKWKMSLLSWGNIIRKQAYDFTEMSTVRRQDCAELSFDDCM